MFLELTYRNEKLSLNATHLVFFCSAKSGTDIYLSDGDCIRVCESYDYIKHALSSVDDKTQKNV